VIGMFVEAWFGFPPAGGWQGDTRNVFNAAARVVAVVPEPCELVLLGTGAVALLGYAARRARPRA
jgi:hypothetical protein